LLTGVFGIWYQIELLLVCWWYW